MLAERDIARAAALVGRVTFGESDLLEVVHLPSLRVS